MLWKVKVLWEPHCYWTIAEVADNAVPTLGCIRNILSNIFPKLNLSLLNSGIFSADILSLLNPRSILGLHAGRADNGPGLEMGCLDGRLSGLQKPFLQRHTHTRTHTHTHTHTHTLVSFGPFKVCKPKTWNSPTLAYTSTPYAGMDREPAMIQIFQ